MDIKINKDKTVIAALSQHFYHLHELAMYYIYLSQQARQMGMLNLANYIYELAHDKDDVHVKLIYGYLDKIDTLPNAGCKKEEVMELRNFATPLEIVQELLRCEQDDRERVDKIADLLFNIKDHETYSFWKWFVDDALKDLSETRDIEDGFVLSQNSLITADNRVLWLQRHIWKNDAKLESNDEDDDD